MESQLTSLPQNPFRLNETRYHPAISDPFWSQSRADLEKSLAKREKELADSERTICELRADLAHAGTQREALDELLQEIQQQHLQAVQEREKDQQTVLSLQACARNAVISHL